ncbi:hypothetical protein FNF29_04542 [Cafeteria roenbergensis]|uniref:Nucleotide-diphospho-sugar transferase domain-containing protein n=1 Tax=Cafeteria roenbergensis TaxID=33653 RepID=A0A5A8CFU2_CAFRO|nr:hypothetical protein FNF29_04542 [Cafeteria roenbergensis]|eukprot:KAA0151618.1 hypothetical protein FNF29_04542 [Cafeteria roenbergensis]
MRRVEGASRLLRDLVLVVCGALVSPSHIRDRFGRSIRDRFGRSIRDRQPNRRAAIRDRQPNRRAAIRDRQPNRRAAIRDRQPKRLDRSTPEGEQKYLIQRNTLIAFANLGESVEMTVFTDSPQIQALCAELAPSVVCSSNFRTNSHGTPVLKSMYLHIENATAAPFYGYVNADIIFTDALLKALRAVQRGIHEGVLHRRVLVVGKRTNFEMPFPLTMSSPMVLNRSSGPSVIDKMAARGKVFQPDAEDFFFVHRNSLDWSQIADFVIGRVAYDNWLVDHAFHQGLDRVDVTNTVHAVHQTGHDGNMAGHTPRVDSNWNKDLATKHGGGYDHGTTDHGNFETRWHGPEMHLIARPQWHAKNRDELLEQQQSMREA